MRVRAVYMEYRDSGSRKFYAAYTNKGRALVHWGRIGTKGQSQVLNQEDAYERIGEKRKRYTVIFDGHFDYTGDWNQADLMDALNIEMAQGRRDARQASQEREQEAIFTW